MTKRHTEPIDPLRHAPDGDRSANAVRQQARADFHAAPSVDSLWAAIRAFAGYPFRTMQGLAFTYAMKPNRHGEPGNEIVFSRKEKSITKATVAKAYERARALGGGTLPARVDGPKKLGVFGASYLYPVLVHLGVITRGETENSGGA